MDCNCSRFQRYLSTIWTSNNHFEKVVPIGFRYTKSNASYYYFSNVIVKTFDNCTVLLKKQNCIIKKYTPTTCSTINTNTIECKNVEVHVQSACVTRRCAPRHIQVINSHSAVWLRPIGPIIACLGHGVVTVSSTSYQPGAFEQRKRSYGTSRANGSDRAP